MVDYAQEIIEARRRRVLEVMGEIKRDCQSDAMALDETGFTPRGVGTNFGNLYAAVAALAVAIEVILTDDEPS